MRGGKKDVDFLIFNIQGQKTLFISYKSNNNIDINNNFNETNYNQTITNNNTEINNNICIFMENCLDTFTFWNLVKCFMFLREIGFLLNVLWHCYCSVAKLCPALCIPHGLYLVRLSYPSLSPGVCSDSCPLS